MGMSDEDVISLHDAGPRRIFARDGLRHAFRRPPGQSTGLRSNGFLEERTELALSVVDAVDSGQIVVERTHFSELPCRIRHVSRPFVVVRPSRASAPEISLDLDKKVSSF